MADNPFPNTSLPVGLTAFTPDQENLSPEAHTHLREGIGLFKQRRIEEAEREIVNAIDIHPQLAPLYNVFALLKIARRAVDTLKESVYLALTTNPEFMDEHVRIGIEHMENERFDEAEEAFLKAVSFNPANTDAHFRLGFLHIARKQYTKAVEVFEYMTRIDAENINAFFMLGIAYSELREYYPCISNLQYALRLQPAFVEARLTLADAYHNQGKYLISIDELATLEQYIPEEDTTYLHRGMILMELERFDEALPYFEKVVALKPEVTEAHELLVGLYENLGHYERAIELAHQVLALRPDNPDMLAALSRMLPQGAASESTAP